MIRSLSPRICCAVAMAPALTEPASETGVRLTIPKSPPLCVVSPVLKIVPPIVQSPRLYALDSPVVRSVKSAPPERLLQDLRLQIPSDEANVASLNPHIVSTSKVNGIRGSVFVSGGCGRAVNGDCSAELLKRSALPRSSMNATFSSPSEDAAQSAHKSAKHEELSARGADGGNEPVRSLGDVTRRDEDHASLDSGTAMDASPSVGSGRRSATSAGDSVVERQSCVTHDLANRFTTIERRTQHLMRRLRYMRTKTVESHVRQQIGDYVDSERPKLQAPTDAHKENAIDEKCKSSILRGPNVKNLSTSALVDFVRKYQMQNVCAASQLHMQNNVKGIKSEVVASNASPPDLSPQFTPNLDVRRNGAEFAGIMNMCVKNEVSTFDCDATESSSGGESDDDSPVAAGVDAAARERKKHTIPLYMRSGWRWASERAAIIARWTWLQAQVSDLEYRIRQQTGVYRQIRSGKGPVSLSDATLPHDLAACFKIPISNRTIPGDADTAAAAPKGDKKFVEFSPACNISNVVNNVDKQSSQLSHSLGNVFSPSSLPNSPKIHAVRPAGAKCPNGFVSTSHANSHSPSTKDDVATATSRGELSEHPGIQSPPVESMCEAARCRPVKPVRKRKLLRSSGLHQVSRKAQRLATVNCHCYPLQTSCVLCTGRYNNTQQVDAVMMPFIEKVSLLDPSYHPVLSFEHDVPLSVYFDSLLKFGSWQKKHPVKIIKKKFKEKRLKKYSSPLKEVSDKAKRKYTKRAATTWIPTTGKIRKKFEKKSLRALQISNSTCGDNHLNDLATSSREYGRRKKPSGSIVSTASSESSGRRTPAAASPGSKDARYAALRDPGSSLRRRVVGNDYDIDNIVIPYSMAASTRVERLQYKEIDTPKWRTLPDDADSSPVLAASGNESDTEDISEDSYSVRHLSKQILEKKRFQNLIMYRRGVRGSRGEAGSTGPDHISPDSIVTSDAVDSLVSFTVAHDDDPTNHAAAAAGGGCDRPRRNSMSQRFDRSPWLDDVPCAEPWPKRQFPLDDDTYKAMVSEQPSLTVSRSPRLHPAAYRDMDGVPMRRTASPAPSSVSMSNCGDDPGDAEWSLPSHDDDMAVVD